MQLLASTLCLLAQAAIGLAYILPPHGAVTIGKAGKYKTITEGLADNSSSVYFIYAGTYHEQVYITRANIKIYGETLLSETYLGNTVTITNTLNSTVAGSDDLSGTVRVHSNNVALYNLNIANPYGDVASHSQAISLSVYGSNFGGYGLFVSGYQDTLLAESGYEYFSNSKIQGAVDFIFGQHAGLWITDSVIELVGPGAITASGRPSNDSFWYVLNDCIVTASENATSYLGRPWADWARVVVQKTYLPKEISPAGWEIWNVGTPNTDHVFLAEYGNYGPGAEGIRANFSTKLTSPIAISTVIPNTTWIDPAFYI